MGSDDNGHGPLSEDELFDLSGLEDDGPDSDSGGPLLHVLETSIATDPAEDGGMVMPSDLEFNEDPSEPQAQPAETAVLDTMVRATPVPAEPVKYQSTQSGANLFISVIVAGSLAFLAAGLGFKSFLEGRAKSNAAVAPSKDASVMLDATVAPVTATPRSEPDSGVVREVDAGEVAQLDPEPGFVEHEDAIEITEGIYPSDAFTCEVGQRYIVPYDLGNGAEPIRVEVLECAEISEELNSLWKLARDRGLDATFTFACEGREKKYQLGDVVMLCGRWTSSSTAAP